VHAELEDRLDVLQRPVDRHHWVWDLWLASELCRTGKAAAEPRHVELIECASRWGNVEAVRVGHCLGQDLEGTHPAVLEELF
jgi:hypothetical protein